MSVGDAAALSSRLWVTSAARIDLGLLISFGERASSQIWNPRITRIDCVLRSVDSFLCLARSFPLGGVFESQFLPPRHPPSTGMLLRGRLVGDLVYCFIFYWILKNRQGHCTRKRLALAVLFFLGDLLIRRFCLSFVSRVFPYIWFLFLCGQLDSLLKGRSRCHTGLSSSTSVICCLMALISWQFPVCSLRFASASLDCIFS